MARQPWYKWKLQLPGLFKVSLFIFCLVPSNSFSQTTKTGQFWSKYKFSHAFGSQWTGELDFSGRFSQIPGNNSLFAKRSQYAIQGWAHYHFSARWRFSSMISYYDNLQVPEIDQKNSKEWRLALQGLYFINKIGYTLNTRGRAEFRYATVEQSGYQYSFRYRQEVKYQKPINSKSFRKGVYYVLAKEELFLRANTIEGSKSFFDKNRFTIGGGYVLTDNVQLELSYVNEFLARAGGNEVVNAISFTLVFNNLLAHIRQQLKKSKPEE